MSVTVDKIKELARHFRGEGGALPPALLADNYLLIPIFIRALCTASQQNESVDVRFGSKADIGVRSNDVRFTPESGHWLSLSGCPLCANRGHWLVYSITSSAEAIRPDAMVRPNALAVLRLMVIV